MKKIIILVLMLFIITPQLIKADGGLELTPAENTLVIKPGDEVEGTFKILNNNEFSIQLENSKGVRELDNTINVDQIDISASWIELREGNAKINSQDSLTYHYKLNVPIDAQEGSYRPMFIFKLSTSQEESGTVASLTQLLPFQFNIYVSESGKYNGELQIEQLTTSRNIMIGNSQNVFYKLNSINNSPTKPLIRIQLVSPNNEVLFQVVGNESLNIVDKNNPISETFDLSKAFNDSTQFGRYTVEFIAKDVLTDKTVSQKISFWYFPQIYVYIGLGVIALAILTLVLVILYKRTRAKNSKKEKHVFMYK